MKEQVLDILEEELYNLRIMLAELPVDNTEPNLELYFITRELGVVQKIKSRMEQEL